MFISLSRVDTAFTWWFVNINYITQFYKYKDSTVVLLHEDDILYIVQETPIEILNKIRNSGSKL